MFQLDLLKIFDFFGKTVSINKISVHARKVDKNVTEKYITVYCTYSTLAIVKLMIVHDLCFTNTDLQLLNGSRIQSFVDNWGLLGCTLDRHDFFQ